MQDKNGTLLEGQDFYSEDGYIVFTEQYLLKRGTCCDSGCRHCPYKSKSRPKVVCMVPSWTETLLECGVEVVGRTRYCIHPEAKTAAIPIVGGTKDIRWSAIQDLHADLLILDQEENPRRMAEQSPIEVMATHVECLEDLPRELSRLAQKLKNEKLNRLAERWQVVAERSDLDLDFRNIPGLVRWIRTPQEKIKRIYYVIWKDPWMVVSRKTFIGSVLAKLGMGDLLEMYESRYPHVDLPALSAEDTLLLFSTEPYPFGEKDDDLRDLFLNSPLALVNGESFSWFGLRSLLFLEQKLNIFHERQ